MSDLSAPASSPMSGADALLWTVGRDPVLRPTILVVLLLDRPPSPVEVRSRLAGLVDAIPRLGSRVATRPFGCERSRFIADEHFDLDAHFRSTALPTGASLRSVLDLAQDMASTGFDPDRPPWEVVLVEDAGHGSAALVVKLHHSVVDGVGGVAVLGHLVDEADGLVRDHDRTVRDGTARQSSRLLRHLPGPRRVAAITIATCAHPLDQLQHVTATVTSVARLLAPAGRPISPLMTERSELRGCEVLDVDTQVFRGAARAIGGTVNDAFMASVVLGLAHYHERHGVTVEALRALMPINVRASDDPLLGNHFVPARFVVPVSTDPSDCIRQVQTIAASWKRAPGLAVNEQLAAGLSALPDPVVTALWGSMLKGDDFCITNVPGPTAEAHLAGSRVESVFALAPPSGAAVNISLVTIGRRACIGIVTDRLAIPDGADLAECIARGVDEVGSLGEEPERVPS